MSINRTSLKRRLFQLSTVLLLPAGISLAESAPQRVTNPYYATVSDAPNAQVVHPMSKSTANPAITNTTTPWIAAPEPVRALPRNRMAALGAAVHVAKLDEAYRANVPAIESVAAMRTNTNAPGAEPSRFAPAPNAAQIPVVAANAPASIKSGYRQDAAVQPVAWMSDVAPNAKPIGAAMDANSTQVGNPLRRMFTSRPDAEGVPVQNAAIGNPLR